MSTMCPGQDMRFWRPEDIFEVTCANCGHVLEFFKDEGRRKCSKCGTRVANPRLSIGCAQWCEHAKECLGFDPKEEVDQDEFGEGSLVDKLTAAMKNVFGNDQRRIDHALAVLEHARTLLRDQEADPKVVLAAAILHDIGIHEAEKKHGSSAGVYQEQEGPPIAEKIMADIGMEKDTIEHVSKIIANHHSAKNIDTTEFRIIWDADWLVNLPEEYPDLEHEMLNKKIEKIFRTPGGKAKARATFLRKNN